MKKQDQITKEEYLRFQYLSTRLPVFDGCLVIYTIYSIIALLTYLYIIFFKSLFDIESIPSYIAVIFVFVSFSIYQYVIIPKKWEKEYENNKAFHIPIEIEINEDAITVKNELINYHQIWKNYVSWKEDNKLILFFEEKGKVLFIPKRILTEEEKKYIYSKVGEYKIVQKKARIPPQILLIFFMVVGALFMAYVVYFNIILN